MNVGILGSEIMTPTQVGICELLLRSKVGLKGLISIAPTNSTLQRLRTLGESIIMRGPVGSFAYARHRISSAHHSHPAANPSAEPASTMKLLSRRCQIPCWSVRSVSTPETARIIRQSGLDVIVAWGAGILRPVLLETPGVVFLNGHAGELPLFGGMNVMEWAVYMNHPIIGTIHKIDNGIDTGDILLQRPLDIGRPEHIPALRAKASVEVWSMIPDALQKLNRGEIGFRKQPSQVKIWYRMHQVLKNVVEQKLKDGSFFAIQQEALAAPHD
jgi:methionyl-tRNA formyltransferase